jgi:hypothetical protein
MALPDYLKIELGSGLIWGHPSGTGVTHSMSINALAASSGRMGVSGDLGPLYDEEYLVQLIVETGTAPTEASTVELYLATTDDPSRWPGKVDGTDSFYPGNVDNNKRQLWPPVSMLVATANANQTQRQNPVTWRPAGRYVVPVVVNKMDQAIRNQTTFQNNTTRVILVPRKLSVQD